MSEASLPRLLYLADVPVESTYAGMVQLYRLLQTYPPDRILVMEGDIHRSRQERRLPGVSYKTLLVGSKGLLMTRLSKWYSLWLWLRSASRARKAENLLDTFKPEAVMTVAHGFLWMTAARFASRNKLPLHLFVHDDPSSTLGLPNPFRRRIDQEFGRVYRQAASRFCVSSFMVEEYRRRYGVDGQVLYASRAHDAVVCKTPAQNSSERADGPVAGYAGSVNSPGYIDSLHAAAEALVPLDGSLVIYGPFTETNAKAAGLESPNVRFAGPVSSEKLVERLRNEVDFLFLPMSFAATDRSNMETSFPSKLTDYTATGLPLVIYGPPYCSVVRWARELALAEVVDTEDVRELTAAIQRLLDNSSHRVDTAMRTLEIGERFFSHRAAWAIFEKGLVSVSRPTQ